MRTMLLMTFAAVVILSGCASVKRTSTLRQPMYQTLTAGLGDVLLRVDRQRSLTNAFGKADVFGRKTNEGFLEVRFAGVEPNGEVVLFRQDVQILTNETTMSRTPVYSTFGSATTSAYGSATQHGNTAYAQGSATTNFAATTVGPASDYHIAVPSGAIPIRLAPGENRVSVGGYAIEIISVGRNAIEYRVTR